MTDRSTRLVKETLRAVFPNTKAYRYNIASIRVRVIDERFAGKNRVQRHKMVQPILHSLPDEVQQDIVFLLLFAPGDEDRSMLNIEFERPSPHEP